MKFVSLKPIAEVVISEIIWVVPEFVLVSNIFWGVCTDSNKSTVIS